MIEPRTLRGFRDYLPALMIPRERLLEQARRVYRSYGFAPIDMPALEYTEILMGKGGEESDRLIYRFKDHGGRDVALRFDLTVPFARFAAQYINQLGTPFKRYHMGPVWRGENTAHGRYREFWQCDFDTIGTTSNAADIETALVIHDLMRALGFERFEIRVNNRLILNGLLEVFGLGMQAAPILRALDKLPKAGRTAVQQEMRDKAAVSNEHSDRIIALAELGGNNREILARLTTEFGGNERAKEGIQRLAGLLDVVDSLGIGDRIRLDLSIARGLDYYTGAIYETFLTDLPAIGSVCSGGRYDNLAELFTKQKLPGVGASLGLDRLLAAMEDLKMLPGISTPAPVLITQFSADRLGEYEKMARMLRVEGIGVEVYPDPKRIGQQMQYAERRCFRLALTAGENEFSRGVWNIRTLATRVEEPVPVGEVVARVRSLLGGDTQ